jgi:hypothetical protein
MVADRPEVAAWKAAYRELDNNTLLSLLPALDAAIEEAKPHLEMMDRAQQDDEQSPEFVTQHLHNAMRLREQGVDVSEYVAQVEGVADLTAKQAPERTRAYMAMFGYLVDLTTRRKWILSEARRRKLLPDPADFPYSDPPSS